MKVTLTNTSGAPLRLQYLNKDVDIEFAVGESKEVDIPSGTEIVDFTPVGETDGEKFLKEQSERAGSD